MPDNSLSFDKTTSIELQSVAITKRYLLAAHDSNTAYTIQVNKEHRLWNANLLFLALQHFCLHFFINIIIVNVIYFSITADGY